MGAAGGGAAGGGVSAPCGAPDTAQHREQMQAIEQEVRTPERRWTSPTNSMFFGVVGTSAAPQKNRKTSVQLPSLNTVGNSPPTSPLHGPTPSPSVAGIGGTGCGGGAAATAAAKAAARDQPGSAGLASRRKFAPSTSKQERLLVVTKREALCGQSPLHGIRAVPDFSAQYTLGGEVMPSCHKGMQVLHAKHNSTGADVVIKIRFKRESFRNRDEENDWRSSTEFMLNLPSCSNIAQLYEVLEDEKAYYVIMEKVSGRDLFESISGQDLLPLTEVKEIIAQILAALVELHGGGRIHKDLKLENIMLDRTPSRQLSGSTTCSSPCKSTGSGKATSPVSPVSVKIIDFDTVEEFVPETPKRTKDVLGTDQYIAQEAYDGNYSPASDMFAVGVIAYRLCTGKFPFKSDIFDDKPGENWVGSPKMKEIRGKLRGFKIKWTYRAFEMEPQACDLLRSMLAVREFDRPTAREALVHPWLARTSSAMAFIAAGGAASEPTSPASTPTSPASTGATRRATAPEAGQRRLLLPHCVLEG